MTAPAFTPGPWKVFYASNGSMLGVGVDRPRDEDYAAGVADAYGGLWGSGGEKEANARLIAAAPELYEACNAAFDFLGGVDDASDVRGQLLTAILKARGEP